METGYEMATLPVWDKRRYGIYPHVIVSLPNLGLELDPSNYISTI